MDPTEIQASENPVHVLRQQGSDYTDNFPVVPNEQTNWLDEQRAVTEAVSLADLSHHMTSLRVTGPDATDFLRDLSCQHLRELRRRSRETVRDVQPQRPHHR